MPGCFRTSSSACSARVERARRLLDRRLRLRVSTTRLRGFARELLQDRSVPPAAIPPGSTQPFTPESTVLLPKQPLK